MQSEKDTTVYAISGEMDPIGVNNGVLALVNRYQDELGLADVGYQTYPGGRHELLNETNRDQVHADIVAWLDGRV